MPHLARSILSLLILSGSAFSQSPSSADLQRVVDRKVEVTENNTIFTLFCLLNLGGYNEENRPEGMHPVRVRVRQQLEHAVRPGLAKRIVSFYSQHPHATPYDYSVVAMSTTGPPDFKFTDEWPDIKKEASFAALAGLPALLRELHGSAPIEEIYAGVQPEYRKYIEAYRAALVTQVAKVMTYCRVSALGNVAGGEVEHAVVIPNLLQSFNNAFSFVLADKFDSIEGPQAKLGYNPHEFVHSITNPLSYDPRYEPLQKPAQPLFEIARAHQDADDLKSLPAFFDENLVRAISLKYLDNGDPARSRALQDAMMREYRSGYTLERFFYEQLGEYEKGNESLRNYYPIMLRHLDVERERLRWEQETKATAK